MNLQARYNKRTFNFINPAGTSRGVYKSKDSWFIYISDNESTGIGECSPLPGLSIDALPDFEEKLQKVCEDFSNNNLDLYSGLNDLPTIKFGFETAVKDLYYGGKRKIFDNEFVEGKGEIHINGLIWMGTVDYMNQQVGEKIEKGYNCLKFKIGALRNDAELDIIRELRKKYSVSDLSIRVDANGAYSVEKAKRILDELYSLQVHSIEQPIKAGQINEMAMLCNSSPVPIALDEELIGIAKIDDKINLIKEIKPGYLIIKPGLLGGFSSSEEWVSIAEKSGIGWWATSALESSIGLNAIAQWVYEFDVELTQGLGTGMIYSNNIDSPLTLKGDKLFYDVNKRWEIKRIGLI